MAHPCLHPYLSLHLSLGLDLTQTWSRFKSETSEKMGENKGFWLFLYLPYITSIHNQTQLEMFVLFFNHFHACFK